MNEITRYRFAVPADVPLLARLNLQLIEDGADFGPADAAWLEARMRRWLERSDNHAVLFEDRHGRVLAYAVYREQEDEIYLRQFLVLRTRRSHGVGRQAVLLLRSRIWSRTKRLTLEVMSANRHAYRFWRSLGYRDCAITLELPPAAQAVAAPAVTGTLWALRSALLHAAHQVGQHCASALAACCMVLMPAAAADSFTNGVAGSQHHRAAHCSTAVYRGAWSAAQASGIDPAWVMAVIEAESSCRPGAVSPAGALGLMQLVPGSGGRQAYRLAYGRDEPPGAALLRDPQVNIRLGVAYLRELDRHFSQVRSAAARLLLAVAAYNCGTDLFDDKLPDEAAAWDAADAERWIGQHAPRETRRYVSRVHMQARRYAAAFLAADSAVGGVRNLAAP